ncbi:hypothetical protein ACEWY4_005440 [Coilia grayii]|uniref:Reverse transcriptase/retrotransposon-derived protein RNase H-like domain-containing protein n=1 Tax=Coilia grayii TaxID=363190 RepID=A0ABD1KIM1_9TELE
MVADFQVRDIKVSGKGVVIVKDHCLGAHRALLGMNVLAACWEGLFEKQQAATFSSTSEHPEWDHIITDCRRISATMAQQHHEDTARVACRYAIAIPALSEALVWARLPVRTYGSESWVMVEPHNRCSEIEVARTLATVHHGRVPVRVRNLQPYPVHLYRHQGLARITAVGPQQVRKDQDISLTRVSPRVIEVGIVQASQGVGVSAGGMPQHMSCESLQGGGLNTDQQRQLLLVKWQHVFSTHDEDYGCTDIIQHQIPTGDATPVHERYRPLPPTLYQEVRGLLQAHLNHLEEVFQAMERYGLKLRPEKCQLFQNEVKFLGHCVSGKGVSPDPGKVAAVQEWQPPTTVRQVRSFLGFVGYYRRFIKGFSKIARPLNGLLVGTGRPRGRGSPPVAWSPECASAFQELKQELLQAPILAYADFTKPFIVYTDASHCGLGAVLAQQQEGVERVIAYASRSLHPAERNDSNYSSFKLELLAMKWALTEKFKDYLWGAKVTVVTDNNPLVHLHTAKLAAVEQRWVAQLANYDYNIRYRPGRQNSNADALSRLPVTDPDTAASTTPTPTEDGLLVAVVEAPGAKEDAVLLSWGWDSGRWCGLQGRDPDLAALRTYLEQRILPPVAERRAQTLIVAAAQSMG